jgi:hypothetical protein
MKPILAVVALLLGSSVLVAQEYDLERRHELKLGHREAFGARLVKDQECRLKAGGRLVPSPMDEKLEVEIGGPRETVALRQGRESEWRLIVKFSTFSHNGRTFPLFKTDDIISGHEGENRRILVNGAVPNDDQRLVMDLLFPPKNDPGTAAEGSAYLPGHKVKVGDTWPVNAEFAQDIFGDIGAPIENKAVHGTVTLESAKPKNGVPCLQVSFEASLDSKDVKGLDQSPKYQGKKFFMLAKQSHDCPVDPSLPVMAERSQMHVEIETPGALAVDGEKKEVITRLLISSEVSTAFLK